jgi:protein-disulfide isomerase
MRLTAFLKLSAAVILAAVLTGAWAAPRVVLAGPTTWHVSTDGSDASGDGTETSPFATIQHGIDAASAGDLVLVHPGVYPENINFHGKNITVGSLFVTTGDEDYILQTVIDGNRAGRVVNFVNGEAATARLSGFTITNGYAHGAAESETFGGGIYCHHSDPTLTHLRVMGNEAVGEGGGLHFRDSSPTVRNVIVTNNHADGGGGGIRYTGGSVNLGNAVVSHNTAGTGGAGLFLYHAEGSIVNALIANNMGGGKGGGLVFDGCSPTFLNVTIVGNHTTGNGGGLNVSYMSQPTLVNSIVWGNTPEQIYFDTQWGGQAITIKYSDVQGGAAGIVTNGQGPVEWGRESLAVSPRFVHAGLGDYRLADDSPVIGAGTPEGAPDTDLEGNPRPNPPGSAPDMGAYESPVGRAPVYFRTNLPLVFSSTITDSFWADRYTLQPGECTLIHWSVSSTDLEGVYFDDEPVQAYGTRTVCPDGVQAYLLEVVRTLSIHSYQVIIDAEGGADTGIDGNGNFYRGDPSARVKMEEFIDFQCPFCARHIVQTEPLIDETYIKTGQVVLVFRNFPLDIHAHAIPAAKSAYCAGQQAPGLFWEMYDWLAENQTAWNDSLDAENLFRKVAVVAGADGALYDACVTNPATADHIQRDMRDGTAKGVGGTPTFYINQYVVMGAVPYEQFRDTIEKAKQTPAPAPEATVTRRSSGTTLDIPLALP